MKKLLIVDISQNVVDGEEVVDVSFPLTSDPMDDIHSEDDYELVGIDSDGFDIDVFGTDANIVSVELHLLAAYIKLLSLCDVVYFRDGWRDTDLGVQMYDIVIDHDVPILDDDGLVRHKGDNRR